jgi:serine protease Do
MRTVWTPFKSITVSTLLVIMIGAVSCRFSFADDKPPQKGSVSFGNGEKPAIQTKPELQAFKNVFADIAEGVIPTVVSVTSTVIDTVVYTDPFSQFFGNPFDDFFGGPRRQGQQPPQQKEERRQTGVGSGVIVSKEGYILTNYHVVGDANEILVTLSDEREFPAEIVGSDSLSDVAIIKIKEKVDNLPVAYLGDSGKLRPGDWVMAVGNPFNLSSTVTTGIVSAVGRHTGGITMYQNFIQTDAAINPGNSGGALVNIEGELIGINTMIYSRSGGYMGIGFAIPINMARNIMEQIVYGGSVSRGWLGVGIADIDLNMKEALGLSSKKGVLINDVFKGQPAEKAGIKVGDVILSIDGIGTGNANDLKNTVASIVPGKKVPVAIIRDGKQMTMTVTLDKRDEEKVGKMATTSGGTANLADKAPDKNVTEKVGFSVGNLTAERRQQLGLTAATTGVVVLEVNPASYAAQKGVRPNDLIKKLKVKGRDAVGIQNVDEFNKALKDAQKGDSIMLYLEREGKSFFVAFKLE